MVILEAPKRTSGVTELEETSTEYGKESRIREHTIGVPGFAGPALVGTEEWRPTKSFLLAMSALCACPAYNEHNSQGHGNRDILAGTSFMLSSSVMQPSIVSMSDITGRRYMIYLAIGCFAAGSLIAAIAGNLTVVIAGRVIQGLGGGSLITLTEVVITDLVPLAYRGTWLSALAGTWALGTVTGPLIGAGFSQNISWRWIFYINLPLIGLGALLTVIFLRQRHVAGSLIPRLKTFDWTGSTLFGLGSTSFLFGISVGGVMYEWSSWRTLVPLLLGAFTIFVFGIWETRYAMVPIINREIFSNLTLISAYIQTILHGIILWSVLYFLVLYYQAVKSYSPVWSAVALLPETLTVTPAGAIAGIVAGKTLKYRWAIWLGWALTTLGTGLLYLLNPSTTVAAWIFLNIPVGMGTGLLFPGIALTIQASSEPRLNGQAAAFENFLRTFGQSIGMAMSGVIFQNALKTNLLEQPTFATLANEYSRDATALIGIINAMPDGSAKAELAQSYAKSLRVLWLALLALAVVGMLVSIPIKGYSLEQEHVTKQELQDAPRVAREQDPECGFESPQ